MAEERVGKDRCLKDITRLLNPPPLKVVLTASLLLDEIIKDAGVWLWIPSYRHLYPYLPQPFTSSAFGQLLNFSNSFFSPNVAESLWGFSDKACEVSAHFWCLVSGKGAEDPQVWYFGYHWPRKSTPGIITAISVLPYVTVLSLLQ